MSSDRTPLLLLSFILLAYSMYMTFIFPGVIRRNPARFDDAEYRLKVIRILGPVALASSLVALIMAMLPGF